MSKTLDPKCPVARTLDIIGERWTILILRDLFLFGPRRFQDLQDSLSGIAPNTISARIKTLEDAGIVSRELYSEHPPRAVYSLTERGLALRPALLALRDWGEMYTDGPLAPRVSVDIQRDNQWDNQEENRTDIRIESPAAAD